VNPLAPASTVVMQGAEQGDDYASAYVISEVALED